MKITEVEIDLLRVPPAITLQDSIQRISTYEWILVTVSTDEGHTGRGWTHSLGMGGAAISELVSVYLRPLLLGAEAENIERIWHRCWDELHAVGTTGITTLALSAVDIALWDVVGKKHNVPIYQLLGGYRDSIPAYASGLNLHLDGDALVEQVSSFVERGYRTIKVKVGRDDITEDIERLAVVREAIGSNVNLLLDVNQKWTGADAARRVKLFERFNPSWIEEPVKAEDISGNARVRSSVSTPVALGESLYSRYQVADYIRAGAVDIVQADVTRVGGFTEWMKIAHLSSANNLPVAPHANSELSVQALCGVENGYILEDIEGGSLTDLGLLDEPFVVQGGMASPPPRPGHGIIFSEAAIDRYRVTDEFTVEPTRL